MHINEFYVFYQIVNATHLRWYYKKDNRAILLISNIRLFLWLSDLYYQ